MFDPHLGGSEDMSGGMQRDADAVDIDGLAPINGANVRGGAKSCAEDARAFSRADIGVRPPARVVAVRVCDDGAADAFPGIDVEVAGLAVQAAFGGT
jgi:hypothetical protein